MLFYSSSEIYGDPTPENIPTPETYRGNVSCTGPRACYDESKRYGETLCVNFAQQRGVPVKIARPFNNYGPGLKITDRRVIPDFARDIMAGRDIVMLSDGAPKRTFCYVADAVGRLLQDSNIAAGPVSLTTSGWRTRRSLWQGSRKRWLRLLVNFGYQGRVVRQKSRGPGLPGG